MTIEEKLINLGVHPSWHMEDYIHKAGSILKLLHEYKEQGVQYCPESNLKSVFYPFSMDLRDVDIVILGTEPFTNYNQATKLPFCYKGDIIPKSIEIIRNTFAKEVYKLAEHVPDMPFFERWFEYEGVLSLYASLTCDVGKSESHIHLWKDFMKEVIRHISNLKTDVFFCLWGKQAVEFSSEINSDNIILNTNNPISENYGYIFEPRFDLLVKAHPSLDLPF